VPGRDTIGESRLADRLLVEAIDIVRVTDEEWLLIGPLIPRAKRGGKKRHILVDTQGLMLQAIRHAADIQDRDGGAMLMAALFGRFPFLLTLYGDGGYQGEAFQKAVNKVLKQVNVGIVKRSGQPGTFVVLPKRWIVERTLSWLNRCRPLAKDWENRNDKARAFLLLASIRRMVRSLCNPT